MDIPTCKRCSKSYLAGIKYHTRDDYNSILKVWICPNCLNTKLILSAEEFILWDGAKKFTEKPRDNSKDFHRFPENSIYEITAADYNSHSQYCGNDCNCNCDHGTEQKSSGCGGKCGGCKH